MTTQTATRADGELSAMESQLDKLRGIMQDLLGKGESVDAVSIEYATLVKKVQGERQAANASKINEAKAKFSEGIRALIGASGLAELTGEAIETVYWRVEKQDGKENTYVTSFNPKRIPRSGNGKRPTMQISVDGSVVKTHDFVTEHLPGVELGRGRVSKENIDKAIANAKSKGVKVTTS